MKHRFFTLDVFTDRAFGGNQLAVFPDASAVPVERMQHIAREFNYSETVFVLPAENPAHARRLRIFTPGAELPFAGHPTVGTAHILAATGAVPTVEGENIFVLEEGVGPVGVSVRMAQGQVTFAQLTVAKLPQRLDAAAPEQIAEALSLARDDVVDDGIGPVAFSCGTPFMFARLRDVEAVSRAELNYPAWKRAFSARGTNELFFFAEGGRLPGAGVHGRMFAPGLGVPEDPATGSAVAALAGYLVARQQPADGIAKWTVEQGVEMGRPSLLYLEADISGGAISSVRVGGQSVIVTEGLMEIS